MANPLEVRSKLELQDDRIVVPVDEMITLVRGIFENIGCNAKAAKQIAEHLTDSNLCGMESHGLMRTLQYVDQFESGYMSAACEPDIIINERGAKIIDGNGGHGIPAMYLAMETAIQDASEKEIGRAHV